MSNPFVGEVRMFGGNFAPVQWAFCDGGLIAISQNETLFSLLGTTYGGDGVTTFALPDLRGRLALGMGQGNGLSDYVLGQKSGAEEVTLMTTQMPSHSHSLVATTTGADNASPSGLLTGQAPSGQHMYASGSVTTGNLNAKSCGPAGGGQPHENLMPAQCVSFIISLYGIYPSRN